MRRTYGTLGLMAITALVAAANAHAVNPAAWQIAQQINRSDSTKTWTSPTSIDLGKMVWEYEFEITKVTGWVRVLFANVPYEITDSIPAEIRMGSGQTTDLPAVLLDDSIAESGTGTTADIFVEIDQNGLGQATFSNIVLGSLSTPFGTLPIQRVDVEATVSVTGYNFGDYDLNGVVNAADYATWKQAFAGGSTGFADGNLDGVVNAADYTVWRDALAGSGGGSGSLAIVPEPAAWLLLGGALSALAIRVRS